MARFYFACLLTNDAGRDGAGCDTGIGMDWLAVTLRHHPELAVFLTLALGYWIGALRIGSFSVGPVTGVLIVGLLIGQMRISISPNVEALFFLMFLFATGYKVGPQFFRGLKNEGLRQ